MKQKRTVIILAVVLACLVGVIVAEKMVNRHVENISAVDEIVMTADPESLTSVSWEKDGTTLSFVNDSGTWKSADDSTFPVDQDAFSEFLSHFAEVHASFVINDVTNFNQYGLEEPQCTMTFSTEDGDKTLKLGGYSVMDSKRYVSMDGDSVYLVDDDLIDYIETNRDTYMKNDVLPDYYQFESLKVTGDTSLNMVLDKEGVHTYTDIYNYYQVNGTEYLPLKDSLAASYITTIINIPLTDYATYNADTEDLSQYGLADPNLTLNFTAQTEEGEDIAFTLYCGAVPAAEAEETDTDADSDSDEPQIDAYVRLDDSNIIYRLDSDTYETLAEGSYNSLRPPEVFALDWDHVTGLSATIDGETYEISSMTTEEAKEEGLINEDNDAEAEATSSSDEDADEELVYVINGQLVDLEKVKDAIDALKISEFNNDKLTGVQEIELTIYLDNEDYPSLNVSIYRDNGESCLAQQDGKTLGLMDRSLMVDVRESLISVILDLKEA